MQQSRANIRLGGATWWHTLILPIPTSVSFPSENVAMLWLDLGIKTYVHAVLTRVRTSDQRSWLGPCSLIIVWLLRLKSHFLMSAITTASATMSVCFDRFLNRLRKRRGSVVIGEWPIHHTYREVQMKSAVVCKSIYIYCDPAAAHSYKLSAWLYYTQGDFIVQMDRVFCLSSLLKTLFEIERFVLLASVLRPLVEWLHKR